MSKLSRLKKRAAQAVNRDDDNLGPDRGTMDQEEARIERAKAEARKEAKREKVEQRAKEARERERERVLNEEEGGDGIISSISSAIETAAETVDTDGQVGTDDLGEAFATDFDGDGETLANEFGLQSAKRAEREDATFNALGEQLNQTQQQLNQTQQQLNQMGSPSESNTNPTPQQPPRSNGLGGGGLGGGGLGGGMGSGAIDPEDFGMGGFGDGGGGLGGGDLGMGYDDDDLFGGGGL